LSRAVTLHAIGNAHIDPVWLWRWPEGLETIRATFASVLQRMEEFAEFRFTGSSAAFYWLLEQTDPEMLAAIRQRVQEGRWEIVGGVVVAARLQHPVRRVVRAPCALRPAILPEDLRRHRHRRLQPRFVWARRHFAPDPAQSGVDALHLHAPRSAREEPSRQRLLVAVARWLAGAGSAHYPLLRHLGR
jgi:hypothetical protein